MTRRRRQILALLLGNYLLIAVTSQVNHAFSPWQLRLSLGGLLVAPATLSVGFRAGATVAFLTGLLLDATAPVWFGTHALLLLAAHAVLYSQRSGLAREETVVAVVAALLANLGIWLALAFFLGASLSLPGSAAVRLLAELGCSQIVLALIGPWFFSLQVRLLTMAGAKLRPDEF